MGDRQGDDSGSPVVSFWIAYVTEGRARGDGKEGETLSHHPKFCPRISLVNINRRLRDD